MLNMLLNVLLMSKRSFCHYSSSKISTLTLLKALNVTAGESDANAMVVRLLWAFIAWLGLLGGGDVSGGRLVSDGGGRHFFRTEKERTETILCQRKRGRQ
jgi:hypothetical protein